MKQKMLVVFALGTKTIDEKKASEIALDMERTFVFGDYNPCSVNAESAIGKVLGSDNHLPGIDLCYVAFSFQYPCEGSTTAYLIGLGETGDDASDVITNVVATEDLTLDGKVVYFPNDVTFGGYKARMEQFDLNAVHDVVVMNAIHTGLLDGMLKVNGNAS